MLKEFKAFAMRGNVLDLAVGIIIGGAFGTIVKSLVDDVIMPPIGLALGNVDFADLFLLLKDGPKAAPPYATLAEAQQAGAVTVNYGLFINSVITFLIVFLIQRSQNKDARAIHIKLNEIVAVLEGASNRLIDVEDLSEEELQTLHRHFEKLSEMARRDSSLSKSHSVEEAEERHHSKLGSKRSSKRS